MIRSSIQVSWITFLFVILFAAATSSTTVAQISVEIEVAGPWSYVQDPTDSNRVIVVAPKGHTMAVFTGEDVSQYSGIPAQPGGTHRLEFPNASCTPVPSSYFLYPVNGVSSQSIQSALSSPSVFSISLPKPCSYESQVESVFKYHARRDVTSTDPERSFTTSMTLHYEVTPTTSGAILDGATGKPIPFGSNAGTSKKAISIVLYQDDDPDTVCDSHSATAFDLTLTLWGAAHVHRIFPQLLYTPGTNYNQQIPGSYAPRCSQTLDTSATPLTKSDHPKAKRPKTSAGSAKSWPKAPGRADCHATQVNVNGAVI